MSWSEWKKFSREPLAIVRIATEQNAIAKSENTTITIPTNGRYTIDMLAVSNTYTDTTFNCLRNGTSILSVKATTTDFYKTIKEEIELSEGDVLTFSSVGSQNNALSYCEAIIK